MTPRRPSSRPYPALCWTTLVLFLLVPASSAFADKAVTDSTHAPRSLDATAWQADIQTLGDELPKRHPDPFGRIGEEVWREAVRSLHDRIATMSREEIVVELHRLVARIGDAHTSVNPFTDPALAMRRYPFELAWLEDGLFVRRAAPEHRAMVGARVLRIGRLDAEAALEASISTVSRENEWWGRAWAPARLGVPEMLAGLGIVENMERLSLEVEQDGSQRTVVVAPLGPLPVGHGAERHSATADWIDLRDLELAPEPPLYEQAPGRLFFSTYLEASQTLYVHYRAVAHRDHDGTRNRAFWDRVFAEADTLPIARLVLDIRDNHGGNGFLNRHVIQQILRRPHLDRPDALYTIIGRGTFSAAQNLANQLDWWSQTTFVGEPTGQRPGLFGDSQPLVLPHSGITVNISTIYHQGPNVWDRRDFIAPDLYTPLHAADVMAGRDPALEAILASSGKRPFEVELEEAVAAGDLDRATALFETARSATIHRFVDFEPVVNALGYRFLGRDEIPHAIAVFELNAQAYPGSANVHDSLGEAFAAAGRREEALAAYQRSLEIDPELTTALHAVHRLRSPHG